MSLGGWVSALFGRAGGNTTYREAAGTTVDEDESGWRRLSGDTQRDLEPLTHERMREMAAYLWQANSLANRLIELPLAYLLAEGVKLKVSDPKAQDTIDRFWRDPINQMDIKLEKRVRELALFGEQCYPAFVNEHSGAVRLGYLDPSLISEVVTDPDNREQPIGVITTKDAAGQERRYRVIVNGPDEELFRAPAQALRASYTDGECFYFAVNTLSSGVRGRSDLLAQSDWLDAYDDFLFGDLDRSKYQRAFVWDVKLTGLSQEQIDARAKNIRPPAPNSVRVHNETEEWSAVTPGLSAADTSETATLLRNHVLGGSTIPEHWFGGGGNVNRAVGAEMAEPTFKLFSMRQRAVKYMLEEIGRFVLRQKAIADGVIDFDLAQSNYTVEAVFPEMIAKDTTRYAAALQQVVAAVALAVGNGYLTKAMAVRIIATVAGRLGVEIDIDQELTQAAVEADAALADDLLPPDALIVPPDESTDSA